MMLHGRKELMEETDIPRKIQLGSVLNTGIQAVMAFVVVFNRRFEDLDLHPVCPQCLQIIATTPLHGY